MILGVTGRAQHGKDTFAARLVEQHGFTRLAFADTLKSMALVLDPFIDAMGVRLAKVVARHGWEEAKTYPEVRRFLQVLGTEAVRGHLGDDAWVEALARKLRPMDLLPDEHYVITDVRFPNEAEAVRSWGGKLIRVERPGFDNGLGTDHPSEQYVDGLAVDYTALNTGTIQELHALADFVVNFPGYKAW